MHVEFDLLSSVLAPMAAATMTVILLWAGAEKLRASAATAEVFLRFGLPHGATRPLALALALTELAIGAGLAFRPGSRMVIGAVLCLAAIFAIAGGVALARGERIACNCFGSTRGGYLGRNQLLALPAWITGSLILLVGAPPARVAERGASVLAATTIAMMLVRAPLVVRGAWRSRADRLAAAEAIEWRG